MPQINLIHKEMKKYEVRDMSDMAKFYKDFGQNIKNLRRLRGLPRDKFAKSLGVTPMTLLIWERGEHRIPAHVAYQIKQMYGTNYEALIPTKP